MAGSLNKVILIGRLGQDPEIREVGTSKVANFSVATDESYTDRNGNKVEKTEWHRIVMWNKAAENAGAYLKKGSLVYIEGKLETRSWENDAGEKRYSTEIKSFSFQMLDNKNDQSQRNDSYGSQSFEKKEAGNQGHFSQKETPFKPSESTISNENSTDSNLENTITGKVIKEDNEDDLPF
tara:strand:+ start:82 stop:621 length:540 start_codon:yes stop_codon:yes gene_type:complete